ncbi:MAG: hypothetical protein ACAI44_28275, partial [Candidatus Sericytochromatia bacterium]
MPTPSVAPFQTQSQSSERDTVSGYILKVEEAFAIKAVEASHQAEVDQSVATFETDLESGQLDAYYKVPAFSIQLAAGSEGSFFTAEGAKKLDQTGAVFAQAVVFNPGDKAQNFKGQFSGGRFFFSGQQNVSPANVTYLITLNPELQTEIYKGRLSAGSEGSFLNPLRGAGEQLPTGLTPAGTLSKAELEAKIREYKPALTRHATQGEDFGRKVRTLKFVPPQEPLALAWTETFARLARAYPEEMRQELGAIRGLPRQLLYEAWSAG